MSIPYPGLDKVIFTTIKSEQSTTSRKVMVKYASKDYVRTYFVCQRVQRVQTCTVKKKRENVLPSKNDLTRMKYAGDVNFGEYLAMTARDI